MTREQLVQMALDAGGRMYSSDEVDFFLPDLERFAKSVYEATFRESGIHKSMFPHWERIEHEHTF